MHNATSPSSFLCTLFADGKGLAYHVSVSFRDSTHARGHPVHQLFRHGKTFFYRTKHR